MALFKYKNSKKWLYDFIFEEQRVHESTKMDHRSLAEKSANARAGGSRHSKTEFELEIAYKREQPSDATRGQLTAALC